MKIRTIIGLILIYLATFMNWQWMWAILFFFWVIPDLFTGVTYLMEPITKKENPFLYWAIVLLWFFSGTYMLIDSIAPKILPTRWSTESAYQIYPAKESGKYEFNYEQAKQDTLYYKTYLSPQHYVVGISTDLNYNNTDESSSAISELWKSFYEDDFSSIVDDIVDDKIYAVYSDYDTQKEGYCKITIGYRTSSNKKSYTGLNYAKVKASKYAVFEIKEDIENKVSEVWGKVVFSDLKRAKQSDVEIYKYNSKTGDFDEAVILVSIPTSNSEYQSLNSKIKTDETIEKQPILAIASNKKYQLNDEQKNTIKTDSIQKENLLESKYPIVSKESFYLVGLQTKADINNLKEMEEEVTKLWEAFDKKNYARFIPNLLEPNNVYLSYTNYTETEVTITLGYKSNTMNSFKDGKGLHAVFIGENSYYKLPVELTGLKKNNTDNEWNILTQSLTYRNSKSCDFEVYTFDDNYNIKRAFMYVANK